MKVSAMVWAQLLQLLMDGTHSNRMLAADTGLSYETVREYTRVLREKKVIHVVMWDQDPRGAWTVPIWKLGPGKDAKRPGSRNRERSRERRLRIKQIELQRLMVGAPL